MPARQARARIVETAEGAMIKQIRARNMEAIRAGATIDEATVYANADPSIEPTFTKTVVIEATPPQPKDTKREPAKIGGERDMLMPGGWSEKDKAPPPKAVDTDAESVKRPMAAPAAAPSPVTQPAAPVSSQETVSTSVETQATAETNPVTLPEGWDDPDTTTWPALRKLCISLALPIPHNRKDAVRMIRSKMEGGE